MADRNRTAARTSAAGSPRDARGDVKLRDYRSARWDEPLIMEMSVPGERGVHVPLAEPEVDGLVGTDADALIPEGMRRAEPPVLPELSQHQVLRHYLRLSQQTMGMDLASDISEGTCTMKYSPKVHDELCRSPRMAELHPLQDEETLQGALQILWEFRNILCAVSGLDEVSLHGGGGAHAAFTNAAVVRAYHQSRGELGQRDEFITTMFSHPCDAAAPATAGFKVITLMPDGDVYPCRRMPVRVGNVLDTPLSEIWEEADLLRELRDPERVPEGCEDCRHLSTCRGGLRCLSHAVTGNPFSADPGCWLAREGVSVAGRLP